MFTPSEPKPSPRRSFVATRPLLLFAALSLAAHAASAADGPRQTIDSVVSHGTTTVMEMDVQDAILGKDFRLSPITGTAFATCQQSTLGFFCLDTVAGVQQVRRWPAASSLATPTIEVECRALPGVDRRRVTCTGFSVDAKGTLWLAATKKNRVSLFQLEPGASCASGWTDVGAYCARERYWGRPSLVDIEAVDALDVPAIAAEGVLALESRQAAVFFTDPAPNASCPEPRVLVTARQWNLRTKEEVLSITLRRDGSTTYVLGVTSHGRVLQKTLGDTSHAEPVFSVVATRAERGTAQCTDTSGFAIRSSDRTGRVYVADRRYCAVLELVPTSDPASDWTAATLSTRAASGVPVPATDLPPVGVSLAPGLGIDLSTCTANCTAIAGPTPDKAAAALLGVQVVDSNNAGITIFRIEGIPDCRYSDRLGAVDQAICTAAGDSVIVDPLLGPGMRPQPADAARQYLNVTALLPEEVTRLYDLTDAPPTGLPPLLIPPQYRGQKEKGYAFQALYVVPQKGLRFRDTFLLELDVPLLNGTAAVTGTDLSRCEAPAHPSLGQLLQWDVIANVSELWKTAGKAHVARVTNTGCRNPTQVAGDRLSLIPYDLEVNPDTYGPTYHRAAASVTRHNDAVFARLVQSLYGELEFVRAHYACAAFDTADGSPLPAGSTQAAPLLRPTCDTLAARWAHGKAKLDKCIAAAFHPKTSAGAESCHAFVSQLENFEHTVPAGVSATDFANRAGELKTRASAIRHLFLTRFLPSIPANGFCVEKGTCPAP